MQLTKAIFWDTDYNSIDWEKHARYVIARVCRFGLLEDWKQIRDYYGLDRIRDEMLTYRDLDPKTMYFLSAIFEIPVEQFACFKNLQLSKAHWKY